MRETIPWLVPHEKTQPQQQKDAPEHSILMELLVLHVARHRDILHRVDAWLVIGSDGHTVTFDTPASYRPPHPVPLRVGDVLCYNFSYLPVLTHTMIYVGAGYVVHYRPHMIFSKEPQEITLQHIDDFTTSQRSRMYVCPHNGYTRLSRYRVALRGLMSVGVYPDLDQDINCQHVIERILANESFSIGVPRVAAGASAVAACAVAVLVLGACIRNKRAP